MTATGQELVLHSAFMYSDGYHVHSYSLIPLLAFMSFPKCVFCVAATVQQAPFGQEVFIVFPLLLKQSFTQDPTQQ